jgi:CRP-like cAMP-binding protein
MEHHIEGRASRSAYADLVSDPKVAALKRVPLFSHCSDPELQFVAGQIDEVTFASGRTLITQGQPSDTFYLLMEGEADVAVDGNGRRTMGPGDFFGEISMLDRGPATATVNTRTPGRMMVMSHMQFRDAIKGNPQLLTAVLAAMADRLREDSLQRLARESGRGNP